MLVETSTNTSVSYMDTILTVILKHTESVRQDISRTVKLLCTNRSSKWTMAKTVARWLKCNKSPDLEEDYRPDSTMPIL